MKDRFHSPTTKSTRHKLWDVISLHTWPRKTPFKKKKIHGGRLLGYPTSETLFTSAPVCSDPELLGNHLSELNNLRAAGEAGGCGHGSYVSAN